MLGAAGALPFIALAIAAWSTGGAVANGTVSAVIAYGAVILSFIGGVHWGFASGPMAADGSSAAMTPLLVASVLPSLVAWVALMLPAPWSTAVLGIAFVAVLPLDRWAMAQSLAPNWWMRLRLPLTVAVAALLFITCAASVSRFGA